MAEPAAAMAASGAADHARFDGGSFRGGSTNNSTMVAAASLFGVAAEHPHFDAGSRSMSANNNSMMVPFGGATASGMQWHQPPAWPVGGSGSLSRSAAPAHVCHGCGRQVCEPLCSMCTR